MTDLSEYYERLSRIKEIKYKRLKEQAANQVRELPGKSKLNALSNRIDHLLSTADQASGVLATPKELSDFSIISDIKIHGNPDDWAQPVCRLIPCNDVKRLQYLYHDVHNLTRSHLYAFCFHSERPYNPEMYDPKYSKPDSLTCIISHSDSVVWTDINTCFYSYASQRTIYYPGAQILFAEDDVRGLTAKAFEQFEHEFYAFIDHRLDEIHANQDLIELDIQEDNHHEEC